MPGDHFSDGHRILQGTGTNDFQPIRVYTDLYIHGASPVTVGQGIDHHFPNGGGRVEPRLFPPKALVNRGGFLRDKRGSLLDKALNQALVYQAFPRICLIPAAYQRGIQHVIQ